MMMSCHRIVRWTEVASLAFLAAIGLSSSVSAGVASISSGFGQYSGAVGNGGNEQIFSRFEYTSVMNGNAIGPIEALPGLDDFFTPPDPNDPSSLGQGIGRGVVELFGAASVSFYTTLYDPDDGSTIYGIENLIAFTPGPAVNVGIGDEFLLGTFTLQNGEWWAINPIHRFTLDIVTNSSDPSLDGKVFSDTFVWRHQSSQVVLPKNLREKKFLNSSRKTKSYQTSNPELDGVARRWLQASHGERLQHRRISWNSVRF